MEAVKHIIAPVDLEEHTEKVVEYASYMANRLSAKLTLLHVVELLRAIGDMVIGTATIEEYNQNRMNHSKGALSKIIDSYPDCSGEVITGDIVDGIIGFAKSREAQLIIIGTHGSKGIEKLLLGSVAERVVKNAHCPTLVMNPYKQN